MKTKLYYVVKDHTTLEVHETSRWNVAQRIIKELALQGHDVSVTYKVAPAYDETVSE